MQVENGKWTGKQSILGFPAKALEKIAGACSTLVFTFFEELKFPSVSFY